MKYVLAVAAGFVFIAALVRTAPITAAAATQPAPATVIIANGAFMPATVHVRAGDKVVFVNRDDETHTVTSDTATFDSGRVNEKQRYTYTFTKPGNYAYHCAIHTFMKGTVIVDAAGPQAAQLQGDALVQALRGGGYVILMRHAATEAKLDSDTVDLRDCTTQRNLSPEGRETARSIGGRVAALGLPIGDVQASPYCRAMESGRLIFGHADVVDGLRDHAVKDATAHADAAAALRPLLATPPAPGKNNVVVTHGFNAKSVTGLDLLDAEAVVVKPDGHGGFAIVGDIKADAWTSL